MTMNCLQLLATATIVEVPEDVDPLEEIAPVSQFSIPSFQAPVPFFTRSQSSTAPPAVTIPDIKGKVLHQACLLALPDLQVCLALPAAMVVVDPAVVVVMVTSLLMICLRFNLPFLRLIHLAQAHRCQIQDLVAVEVVVVVVDLRVQLHLQELTTNFGLHDPFRDVQISLERLSMKPGDRLATYQLEFDTHTVMMGYNKTALFRAFYHGLLSYLKDTIAQTQLLASLAGLKLLSTDFLSPSSFPTLDVGLTLRPSFAQ
ncbi:hypothetical protein DFH08DRAFT_951615 [Mycena albidolilacea]|uniref:Uncharacterized protein n=1 Tax=Mycena albidolilacea TaxID=1033008 RepID=A0AAD7AJX8_9AGAR|nr:hypothetical protein DFH08DRAFT_951615 [Mycena albidolilacea]